MAYCDGCGRSLDESFLDADLGGPVLCDECLPTDADDMGEDWERPWGSHMPLRQRRARENESS